MIPRLQKGGEYYFISLREYRMCKTRDEHFGSDDKHYREYNYFTSRAAAEDAEEAVQALALPESASIAAADKEGTRTFIAEVRDTVTVRMPRKRRADAEDEPEEECDDVLEAVLSEESEDTEEAVEMPAAAGPTDAERVERIRKALTEYNARKKMLMKRSARLAENVLDTIKKNRQTI